MNSFPGPSAPGPGGPASVAPPGPASLGGSPAPVTPALATTLSAPAAAPAPNLRMVEAALTPRAPGNPETELPFDLREQLGELEQWALANQADARRDAIAFWALKVPAILASASAGVWAHFNLTTVAVLMGAVASFCVIIDGVHPRGMLRNVHLRAFHDLRGLTAGMIAQWRSRNREAHPDNIARNIIRQAEPERQRISAYIRDAETMLKTKSEG